MKEKIKIDFLINSIKNHKKRIFSKINSRIRDLERYFYIKKEYEKGNVKNNLEFQKTYKKFYVMRFLVQRFFKEYFIILSNRETDLRKILDILYTIPRKNGTKAIHFSFVTKLLHTKNNDLPIYDSLVGEAFGLKVIGHNKEDKINSCIKIYDKLKRYYKKLLTNERIKKIILDFRKNFNCGKEKISDTKVLDFIIWSKGQLEKPSKSSPKLSTQTYE